MEKFIKKAGVLIEAIPYINAFRRKIFVIKYGGSILNDDNIRKGILEDIVFLSYVGIRTILIHGGGPHINSRLKEKGIKAQFHEGIRVTNKRTLKIVLEELQKLNNKIVEDLRSLKGDVTGLKGHENIIHVEKKKSTRNLGYVGTVKAIDQVSIKNHLKQGRITVISPMGICGKKQPHNINADEVASALSVSMKAEKLVLLTNVQGVMTKKTDPKSLMSSLSISEVKDLIKRKVIKSGMIPKVNACLEALNGGVKKAHIIDARIRHALLLEIFTDRGIGTQILKET